MFFNESSFRHKTRTLQSTSMVHKAFAVLLCFVVKQMSKFSFVGTPSFISNPVQFGYTIFIIFLVL